MRKARVVLGTVGGALGLLILATGYGVAQDSETEGMSFFIASRGPGSGGDLGGLGGADAHCQALAEAAGAGDRVWRAYLSTARREGATVVHARDRIGSGPWFNAVGVRIALDPEELHADNNLNKETALDERGETVNGRGDSPNRHDIITGSQLDGTAFPDGEELTCDQWTSSGNGSAQLGHHDRQGGGADPSSWNSAHASRGCSQNSLQSTGGDGLFYCFVADSPTAVEGTSWGSVKRR